MAALRKIGLLLTYVSLMAPAYSQQRNETRPLGLKEVYFQALEQNPAIKQSVQTMNQMEAQIPVARSFILPTLTATAFGERKKDASLSNVTLLRRDPYELYNAGLHLVQPIFAFGALDAIDSAKKDQKISELGVEITKRNLANSIIQTYYQAVVYMKNVESLTKQEKIVHESLSTTQHRQKTGRSQLLDVLQVKTQIALLSSQILDAKNQVEIALANLANLLGQQQGAAFNVQSTMSTPDLKVFSRNVDLKSANIPELVQNQIQIDQVSDQRGVTQGKYLPSANLFGDYIYQNFDRNDLFRSEANSWILGVNLNIPIFNGFAGHYQDQALIYKESSLREARKVLENQTSMQIVASRKKLESSHQAVLTGQIALDLAQQSSNEAIRQYKLATIDFLQFLTIQQAYIQAEQALNNYKYNYIIALSNYYVSSGQDMNELVDTLESAKGDKAQGTN